MRIEVDRFRVSNNTTLGHLRIVDGAWRGFVLEDGPSPNPYGIKVPGETRIPDGDYELSLTKDSPMAKRYRDNYPMWHRYGMVTIGGVPGFTAIRIHPGNTHLDTDGCLLLGYGVAPAKPGEPDTLLRSFDAYRDFYMEAAQRLSLGEEGRIVIRSAWGP